MWIFISVGDESSMRTGILLKENEFMNDWVQEVFTSSKLQVKWEVKHKKEIP